MNNRPTICHICSAAFSALLAGAFLIPVAQANEVPIYIEYTGSGFDIPVFDYTADPFPANLVQGSAKGSFGPSHTVIMSKFEYIEDDTATCDPGYWHFHILYASAVTSFKDGSQLFAVIFPGDMSDMCLNPVNGDFSGVAKGMFIGGVGRFEGAGGTFDSPFEGQNLTDTQLGQLGFRSMKGSIEGTVVFN